MKKIKVTKVQYDKLVSAGLLIENDVDKTFKKAFNTKPIYNLNYVDEEKIVQNSKFNINKPNPSIPKLNIQEVENFIKYVYGVNEVFSPYWSQHNLMYEDLCEALEQKGLLVKKENTYRIPKSSGTPEFSKKAIHETLTEMINTTTMSEDYPLGAEFDSQAPYNRPDTQSSINTKPATNSFDIVYYNDEMAIFTNKVDGSAYIFNHTNLDKDRFEDYAEKHGFKDADGDMEYYDDWEVDADTLYRYFNNTFDSTNVGEGLKAFDSGSYEIVKIDDELKQDLLTLYDKDQKLTSALSSITENFGDSYNVNNKERTPEEEKTIVDKLKSIRDKELSNREPMTTKHPNSEWSDIDQTELELDEMTTAASSGAFVAPLSGGPISNGPNRNINDLDVEVVSEMDTASAGRIGYDNPGFKGITRNGDYVKSSKTKAEKNTQWAGGSFVKIDDCTKLNNNKEAQNGGCNSGGDGNVVKQIKTKGNINAPSLSENKKYSIYKFEKFIKKQ